VPLNLNTVGLDPGGNWEAAKRWRKRMLKRIRNRNPVDSSGGGGGRTRGEKK